MSRSDPKTMSLSELGLHHPGARDLRLTGMTEDSRAVRPGMLFVALPGAQFHGARFIGAAVKAGAAAILTDAAGAMMAEGLALPVIVSPEPRAALARLASLWFGPHPGVMVAVTGTNGKTSVSSFTRQIWEHLGLPGISAGTTGVEGAWSHPLAHTTPDPITLHRVLAEARAAGVSHGAMEASSHGLDQHRLDGVLLAAAGFTNFTQDHLDYHESFEAYFEAKLGLFTRCLPDEGVAVVNLDDPKGEEIAIIAAARGQEVIGVGRNEDARLRLIGQRFDGTGQEVHFSWQGQAHLVRLELIGGFQAENVLLAAGLAIGAGAGATDVFRTLPELTTVRGRMELAARRGNGASVFVDYAHTPDAVATAIAALRPHVMGRLVAIIGAGGDRDAGKRPLMGQAAADAADAVIVTDDNPRSEDPAAIRAAVLKGAPAALDCGDRAEAILRGVDMLGAGDALLVLGKGHETGQTVGDDVLPFDDSEQASLAVAVLEGRV